MPDAEKIIFHALRDADVSFESATVVPAIANALREAGMLTETEWEYGVSWLEGEDRVHLPVDSAWRAGVEVRRISLGYPNPEENFVSRRCKAGPWEPVREEAADA